MQHELKSKPFLGLLIATVIVILWIASLVLLLSIDSAYLIPFWVLPAVLVRTFFQTGLFIVAHDAIHGVVFPGNLRLNHWVGQIVTTLYALLPYQKLSRNHWQHHRCPGKVGDPDFHDGVHRNLFAWYLKFMQGYLDSKQKIILFFGIGTIYLILQFGFHVSVFNLFLFWILPIVLSSMQLFLFGTYLPHRLENVENRHHATSSNYSLPLSFLTCYHFGYHWEHHEYPFLPWYGLPAAYQNRVARVSNTQETQSGRIGIHPESKQIAIAVSSKNR